MTDSPDLLGNPPQSMLLAIEQLISGERSIAEFRDEMLNTIYETPTSVATVRSMVDDYARRGLIPEQIQRLLVRDIDKVTNEDLATAPTEFTFTADTHSGNQEETASIEVADLPPTEIVSSAGSKRELPLQIGSLLRDRFEIVGKAAGGSMGVVFKAIDRRLAEAEGGHPYVAIKLLAPEYSGHTGAMRALQQEATKGRYLNHPNIVRFLDLDRSGDDIFLVMEWLEGRPLSIILNEQPGEPLEPERAWSIVERLGSALIHAHELGVTHADVKPGNVMILPDGSLKLLDFGIARARGDLAARAPGVDPKILNAATPAYASPQVLSGDPAKPVDDIFSLACVAYRLLSGQRVFRDKSAKQAMAAGMWPRRLRSMSTRRWNALERALSFDAVDRQPNVRAFMDDLGLGDGATETSWKPFAVVASCLSVIGALAWFAINSLSEQDAASLAAVPPRPNAIEVPLPAQSDDNTPRSSVVQAARPVPTLEASVDRADWVVQPPDVALSLILPSGDSVVPAVEATLSVIEGAPPAMIALRRNNTSESRTLRLIRQTTDEVSMIALNQRLQLSDSQVSLTAGETVAYVSVIAPDNTTLSPTLRDRYQLLDVDSGELLARLELQVIDNDLPSLAPDLTDVLTFSSDELVVLESDLVVRIPVWRLNPSVGNLAASAVVRSGTALADEDFVAAPTLPLSFDVDSDRLLLLVPLVSDSAVENEEQFQLELPANADLAGLHSQITVRILDTAVSSSRDERDTEQ
ncbi:MAG: protein kinase [Pseudomonadota bacterium]